VTARGPDGSARRNLRTALKRRRRAHPMQRFDRLPPELRCWLHDAALPWSPDSALRLWRRALAECRGDVSAVRARLDRVEARALIRDAAALWGPGHPALGSAERSGFVN
jgi:hypothetical protein